MKQANNVFIQIKIDCFNALGEFSRQDLDCKFMSI
jgi:hypothetical protein